MSDRGTRFLDDLHIIFEAHPKVRIVPDDEDIFSPALLGESQILDETLVGQRLVRNRGVDTEATGIGAAEAPQHGDRVKEAGALLDVDVNEVLSLFGAGQALRLLFCSQHTPPRL